MPKHTQVCLLVFNPHHLAAQISHCFSFYFWAIRVAQAILGSQLQLAWPLCSPQYASISRTVSSVSVCDCITAADDIGAHLLWF